MRGRDNGGASCALPSTVATAVASLEEEEEEVGDGAVERRCAGDGSNAFDDTV